MTLRFRPPDIRQQGILVFLLKESYAELVQSDPEHWLMEEKAWEQFDLEIFKDQSSLNSCVFLSCLEERIVGFASFFLIRKPDMGSIGHNCILPEFRRRGYGIQQIHEILRRFRTMGVQRIKTSTLDIPYFLPAQHMYLNCGFKEKGRTPWNVDPNVEEIHYEWKEKIKYG